MILGKSSAGKVICNYKLGVGTEDFGNNNEEFRLAVNGKTHLNGSVLIGNSSNGPNDLKLSVEGSILAREVKVSDVAIWPDYVFESDYKLMSLNSLEKFLLEKKHLPGIPSHQTIKTSGEYSLVEMNKMLLTKVEELTLYIISLNKEIDLLKNKN